MPRSPRPNSTGPAVARDRHIPNPPLHLCMTGLVVLNLVLVWLTEAARLDWLLPLLALTVASPILARFKERFLYRALWNVGVIGFFVVLVRHAMSADLAFVLQDGLILAVLCQVHLLNNLRANQRPDLLFINSYLIAIITAYITVDLGFSGAFLLYAPFYVLGLQFLATHRPDRTLSRAGARAVAFDGFKRSAVLMAASLLVFLFWPRDFQREALFSKYIQLAKKSSGYDVGFSSSLDLTKRDISRGEPKVVMTIELLRGRPEEVSPLWRGATLGRHLGDGSWAELPYVLPPTHPMAEPLWQPRGRQSAERGPTDPTAPAMRVTRKGGSTQRIFLPREATRVVVDESQVSGSLQTRDDAVMRYSRPGQLTYDLAVVANGSPIPRTSSIAPAPDQRAPFLALIDGPQVAVATRVGRGLRGGLADDATAIDIAESYAGYLRGRHRYRWPGEDGAAGSLAEFLSGDAGGHCEFFASALAIMLRLDGVPARIVTGYRLPAFQESTRSWSVSNFDAHAWVEVFDEDRGWCAIDPTPAADTAAHGPGVVARARLVLARFWNQVTGFDADARAAAVTWLAAVPDRMLAVGRSRPLEASAVVAALAGALMWLRLRQRLKVPPAIRRLRDVLRRASFAYSPSETPREILRRAEAAPEVSDALRSAIRAAVEEHEDERYAA